MTTKTKPTPPAPLSPYKLHSPAEQDIHQAEWAAYREAVQEEESSERLKEQTAKANANRLLSRDDYFQLAKQRKAEQAAKEAQRETERIAKEEAEIAYFASRPEVVEITEASEFHFLMKFQQLIQSGYELPDDGIQFFVPGCYSLRMSRSVTTNKRGAK